MGPWAQRLIARELQVGLHQQCWGQAELWLIPCSIAVGSLQICTPWEPGAECATQCDPVNPGAVVDLHKPGEALCLPSGYYYCDMTEETKTLQYRDAEVQESTEMVKGALAQARHLKLPLSTQTESA